jgi:UDP-N-acetylmuramate dehydrogenase
MELHEHADLSAFNTFGLCARARWLALVRDDQDLPALLSDARFAGLPRILLGGGSNLVFRGGEIAALMIKFSGGSWRVVARDGTRVVVEADAGMTWHDLVSETVAAGLGGIENLALIPGTAGAAPVQNIGAYGVELSSVLTDLDAIDLSTGETHRLRREDCAFAYRDSVFKHAAATLAITRIRLQLAADAPLQAGYRDLQEEWQARGQPAMTRELVFDMVCAIRRRKLPDPAHIGNAGSFFKNPQVSGEKYRQLCEVHPDVVGYPQADGSVKLAAGWLIDRAGWKGFTRDGVGVHDRQALVLVNRGGATGAAVLALAAEIAADVLKRYAVALEMEPVVL